MQRIKCQIIKNLRKIRETSGKFAHKFQILENDIIMILKVAQAYIISQKYHLLKNDIKNINILEKVI
jgi:dTDP-4-dehydrorhamnose 3,5-epimerase-like enzyme